MSDSHIANLPAWDTTEFYHSFEDTAKEQDLERAKLLVDDFVELYKGKVNGLDPFDVAQAYSKLEALMVVLYKPGYYLHTIYEAGGDDVEAIAKEQSVVDEKTAMIANELAFWDVEFSRRSDLAQLALAPELVQYKNLIEQTARSAKHVLSEEVEKVLNLKSLTSFDGWAKLYTDQKANIAVTAPELSKLVGNPVDTIYRTTDFSNLLKHKDREVRRLAYETLTNEYKHAETIVLEAYNNILMDKKINDTLRGYETAEESKTIANQLTQAVVDSLIQAIEEKTALYQRFIRLKQQVLGLDTMKTYDMSAEVHFDGVQEKVYSWEDCQRIILEAFGSFDTQFRNIAKEFFDKNWIDAVDRPKKYGGAFMSDFAAGYHPLILCNYKGKISDVLTVAHELGHGIHSYIMHTKQTFLNTHYPMSVAEIASLCCETVVFDALIKTLQDPREKLQLYIEKVDDEAGNIFIGGLGRYKWEKKMHEMFRESGKVSKEVARELWIKEYYGALYGDTVEFVEGGEYTWESVAHFTNLFYNYVYASGLLISSCIYHKLDTNPELIPTYKEILGAGSSLNPVEMLKKLDLDIENPDTWAQGFALFEKNIVECEKLWTQIQG
jgi:oligoendopeptidase F